MFVAPVLFIIHALLTGLSLLIASLFHWTAGFSFSAGLIDYVLSLINPVANHPLMLLVQGIVFFILYYIIFRIMIKVLNLNTIGRGDNLLADPIVEETATIDKSKSGKYHQPATQILEGLGGKENIKDVTNCTTRLRLTVNDESKVEDTAYFTHQQMSHGLVKSGKNVQVVVGMTVPQVREAFEHLVFDENDKK